MHILFISLLLLTHLFALDSSPDLLNVIQQAAWTKNNEIIFVDAAPMSLKTRVLRFDINSGKLYPIYNSKFSKNDLLCFISSDGKMIASYNLKTYEMIVTDLVKKKTRFRDNLRNMIIRCGYREIITIRDIGGRDIEHLRAYPCFLSDDRFILVLEGRGVCGSYYSHMVTVWYNNGSLSAVEIHESSRGSIPPIHPVSDTSQKNCIVFIYRYFNIEKGKVLDVFDKKMEEEIREDKGGGCGAIFGNYIYFTHKGYLWSYDINRRKLEKLPISPSTVKKISSLYVTEKYIYWGIHKDQVSRAGIHIGIRLRLNRGKTRYKRHSCRLKRRSLLFPRLVCMIASGRGHPLPSRLCYNMMEIGSILLSECECGLPACRQKQLIA